MAGDTSNIAFLSASELATEIASGRLTSLSLTELLLDRIGRYDNKLNAFIAVYADEARAAAAAADRAIESGHRIGPLHGIPVAVKDIVDVAGRVTTGGSKVWANRVSAVTATIVQRLIAAGLIVIGKTHTVEFAMGSFGTNQNFGTPWNPWDLEHHRIPGGSSAGSGVSVAAGLVPWAIGTDTGGSVRLPGSFCGIVGFKSTIGLVSRHGVLPLSTTLDTPGPMCRCVEDAVLLYNLMRGPDPEDPVTLRQPSEDPYPTLRNGVRGLRLARLANADRTGVDADVLTAYDESLQVLNGLGAQIVDLDLPRTFAEMGELTGRIIGAEGYSVVGHLVDDETLPIDKDIRPRIQLGRDMPATDYLRALAEQETVKREFEQAMADVDALITPTTTTAAPLVEQVDQTGSAAHFTRAVNLLEGCAVSLPNGRTSAGLPTSIHVVCAGYHESMALRIAWALEQATPWHEQRPQGFDL